MEGTEMGAPLLRSPIFPGVDAAVSLPGGKGVLCDLTDSAIDRLFCTIRDARVGGCFWAPPHDRGGATAILRARSPYDIALLPPRERAGTIVVGDIDPWSVLDGSAKVFAHGDDEWVALATIAECDVHVLSPGCFGAPGEESTALKRRAAESLIRVRYRDPFHGQDADIETSIAVLADWRRTFEANRNIVAACGFSWWKRREIARFLWTPENRLRFFRSEQRAIAHAAREAGAVAVWPSRVSSTLFASAKARRVPVIQVEDGFVRSVGLGSNLVPPSSVAVDRCGIHYDPGRTSDLEVLLADGTFPAGLLTRAARLRESILNAGISKYGSGGVHMFPPRKPGRRLVLVPGQVEDDQSVRLGGGGLTSNLELLQRTRALEPDAEIWFRPHPDVDAGHRTGAVREVDALLHANRIVRGGGMAALLDQIDAVHVLTSLTGFEALLRGRDVTCHGTPFYAGWGLTQDLAAMPARRGRRLTLDALVAAVLIIYPRYLDPVTGLPCSPEVLIGRMRDGAAHNRLGWVSRVRGWQGRLSRRWS